MINRQDAVFKEMQFVTAYFFSPNSSHWYDIKNINSDAINRQEMQHIINVNSIFQANLQQYWPNPGQMKTFGNVMIEGLSENSYGDYCCTFLNVTEVDKGVSTAQH